MALQDDVRALARLPAFGEFEQDALRLIAFSAETRVLRVGDVLFRKGEASDGGFVLLSGSIAVDSDGAATVVVVAPPALLGEAALATETRHPATATAREPSSGLKISRSLYLRVLQEHPETAIRVRRSLAARLLALQRDVDAVGQALTR